MEDSTEQRPLGELFAELARETGTLVRQEVDLARTEMTSKLKVAVKDVAMVGVGAALALAGGLALLAAAILALAMVLPLWLSALIVGAVVIAIGAGIAMAAIRSLKNIDPVPRATVETLVEDKQWLKEQVSR
jgi:hypothetical protein